MECKECHTEPEELKYVSPDIFMGAGAICLGCRNLPKVFIEWLRHAIKMAYLHGREDSYQDTLKMLEEKFDVPTPKGT